MLSEAGQTPTCTSTNSLLSTESLSNPHQLMSSSDDSVSCITDEADAEHRELQPEQQVGGAARIPSFFPSRTELEAKLKAAVTSQQVDWPYYYSGLPV